VFSSLPLGVPAVFPFLPAHVPDAIRRKWSRPVYNDEDSPALFGFGFAAVCSPDSRDARAGVRSVRSERRTSDQDEQTTATRYIYRYSVKLGLAESIVSC
jgi:hypothetical protein